MTLRAWLPERRLLQVLQVRLPRVRLLTRSAVASLSNLQPAQAFRRWVLRLPALLVVRREKPAAVLLLSSLHRLLVVSLEEV